MIIHSIKGGFVMDKKAVIITGGSSGMGKAMAKNRLN